MANSSDIIKIGFDYRSSLAQFEKETNGVFDGISEKVGKQKIILQLDAKDDKIIEKIKELQKLKLDKFTFEFASSGTKEQLKTLAQLENKIIEIMNLSKGIKSNSSSIIDAKDSTAQIDKLQNKLEELAKKYNELSNKKFGSYVSGKDINLVDNEEFKRLSDEFSLLKDELFGLKREMQLFEEATVSADTFVTMERNVNSLIIKVGDLIDKYVQLSAVQSNAGKNKSNISSVNKDVFQDDTQSTTNSSTTIKEESQALEQVSESAKSAANSKEQFSKANKEVKASADSSVFAVKEEADALEQVAKSADNKKLEDQKRIYKELNDTLNKYETVSKRIASGKVLGSDEEEVAKLQVRIEELQNEPILSKEQLELSQLKLEKIETTLEDIQNITREITLNSLQSKIDSFEDSYNKFLAKPKDFDRSNTYKTKLLEYRAAIDAVIAKRDELATKDFITEEELKSFTELKNEADNAANALKNMGAAEKGSTSLSRNKLLNKIGEYLENNTNLSKKFRTELKALQSQLELRGADANVADLTDEFLKLQIRIRAAGQEGKSFLDTVKDKAWYGFATQIGTYFGFNDIIRYIGEAANTVRELDTALTEMRKVSDEGLQSLRNYQNISFDVADEIGSTALELQDATATWMRLGETLSNASESAKDATILLNVSEFENIDDATESLVAMSQAYQELDKMEIIDVLDNIGNRYSIATDELAQALQDSAATLKTQGNDLYEAVALLTAGNAITQDASKTAGGIRTISLRLAGTEEAKNELASLGEDVDDFIVQTNSKTQQLIKDYTSVASNAYQGVDVLDANGNLRNTYNILLDISKIYKEIQKEDEQAGTNRAQALVEYIAGKNRSNIASSILLNPELLENVYKSALNSEGAAMKELDAYMESLDAKIAQFQNRLQELEADLIDSDLLKNIVDLGTGFIHFLDSIIDKFGVAIPLATAFGTALAIKNVGIDMLVAY